MDASVVQSAKDIQQNSMPCTSNFEDHSFYSVEDHTDDHCGSGKKVVEDDEVNILDCTGFDEIETSGCNDGTDEFSSSFSGTISEHETGTALNDQEAESMISADNSLPFWVRKKKLTDNWRKFIQPIMWRCKWIELKIKEFQKQAQMYDKEVEESCQRKELELENLKSEELGIKALPHCRTQKNRLRKRKKRKRIEGTSDVASYASNHNLFSYYKCRKASADIAHNDNSRIIHKRNKSAIDETVFSEETPLLEFMEGDTYIEKLLLKIEAAKSEVCNLKNRVEKVLSENPSGFSPVNTLNLPRSANVFTSSEQQKPQLVIKNEDEKPIISEEKQVKSASVSSHHDIHGNNETTEILLSEIPESSRREGKAIVPDQKLQKTEQTSVDEEGPSRTTRKRTPRNREVAKEEINPKRQRVSREKPKSNVIMASRFNHPKKKRKRGKRRSCSAGLRRRS